MDVECAACYEPDPRSWWQRTKSRLFPARHCFLPEAPAEFKDCTRIEVVSNLNWADRLRILLTGVFVVEAKIVTENSVGASISSAVGYVGLKSNYRMSESK